MEGSTDYSVTMSAAEKRELYRAGKYVFRAPDVCSAAWDETAWIAWIDHCHGWRP